MGRRKKGYEPIVTEENQALANEYLEYIGQVYSDYLSLFKGLFKEAASDVASETILKTYNSIRHNGMRKLSDTDIEKRHRQFRDYFFISAKLNYLTYVQGEQKQASNGIHGNEADGISVSSSEKVIEDLKKDYLVMKTLEAVEDNFDETTYYLFRTYHLCEGMTYKRLKEETNISNCKSLVVSVNRWLREHLDKNKLLEQFNEEYADMFEFNDF